MTPLTPKELNFLRQLDDDVKLEIIKLITLLLFDEHRNNERGTE
ncbi:hypothetical protein [Streptococcus thoraltensis]|nr:hypothetical protein [Streptococcus thoraltensis]